MITFTHRITYFGNLYLECSGHAGEAGSSLTCAAASALTAALIRALRRMETPRLRLCVTVRDGFASVRCRCTPETAAMARMAVAGFEWLARQSPREVRVVSDAARRPMIFADGE